MQVGDILRKKSDRVEDGSHERNNCRHRRPIDCAPAIQRARVKDGSDEGNTAVGMFTERGHRSPQLPKHGAAGVNTQISQLISGSNWFPASRPIRRTGCHLIEHEPHRISGARENSLIGVISIRDI